MRNKLIIIVSSTLVVIAIVLVIAFNKIKERKEFEQAYIDAGQVAIDVSDVKEDDDKVMKAVREILAGTGYDFVNIDDDFPDPMHPEVRLVYFIAKNKFDDIKYYCVGLVNDEVATVNELDPFILGD